MTNVPAFFTPGGTREDQETVYAELARWCGRPVPPLRERIYSITYRHDGEEWVATVGEHLRGSQRSIRRRGRRKVETTVPVADPATVLAIFAGTPFMVVTNFRIVPGIRSAWENPFLAGQPQSVTYFASPA